MSADREKVLEARFDDYIAKPNNSQVLLTMIIDISVKAFAIFCAQVIAWAGFSVLLGFFMYYNDDPTSKPTKVKNTIYTILVAIAFFKGRFIG